MTQRRPHGVCGACGGRAAGVGDLMCGACWRLTSRRERDTYLAAWREGSQDAARVRRAAAWLVNVARARLGVPLAGASVNLSDGAAEVVE